MITPAYLRRLFASVDARDAGEFANAFTDSGRFRFGNAPALTGPEAVADVVTGFFDGVAGLEHRLDEIWALPDATVCHGEVRYTRHDGSRLDLPFAVIVKGEDGAVTDYLIFVDNSALFAAA